MNRDPVEIKAYVKKEANFFIQRRSHPPAHEIKAYLEMRSQRISNCFVCHLGILVKPGYKGWIFVFPDNTYLEICFYCLLTIDVTKRYACSLSNRFIHYRKECSLARP